MDEHEVVTVPLSAVRSIIAATWMNGVNAGVNEGYAAHEDTDRHTERALALLLTQAVASERARLKEVLEEMQDWLSPGADNSESGGWVMAVRYLARRMEIALEWPAPVYLSLEGTDDDQRARRS